MDFGMFSDPSPATVYGSAPPQNGYPSQSTYDPFFYGLDLSPPPPDQIVDFAHLVKTPGKENASKIPHPSQPKEDVSSKDPVVPIKPLNGKQMIKMDAPPKRKRAPRKKPSPQACDCADMRHMEKFVCLMFCHSCQENYEFDGYTLKIRTCQHCRERIKLVEKLHNICIFYSICV